MPSITGGIKRKIVQLTFALLTNANIKGFANGEIYNGASKTMCVPGLNCYSCPGAVAACPIGALQAMLTDPRYKMSYYVIGLLAAFGLVFGRAVCGWLCPFGLIQECIHRLFAPLTGRFFKRQYKLPYVLRYVKYLVLFIFVIIMPLFVLDSFGFGIPYFCKLICPAGTIEGALPLLLMNGYLRELTGALFILKVGIASAVIIALLFSNRFFCKYICPLGAIYSVFNKIAFIQLQYTPENCTACGKCEKACVMAIDPRIAEKSAECIRCGKCADSCMNRALRIRAYP